MSLSVAIAILISSTLAGFSTLASNTAGIAMTIDHMQDFIQNSYSYRIHSTRHIATLLSI